MTILVYDAQGAGCYGCPKIIEQFCSKTLKYITNVHILREHFIVAVNPKQKFICTFYYEICLHNKLQFHRFQSIPNIFAT